MLDVVSVGAASDSFGGSCVNLGNVVSFYMFGLPMPFATMPLLLLLFFWWGS